MAVRTQRTPVGVDQNRCPQPGGRPLPLQLHGGFGWYCFVFALDAVGPDGIGNSLYGQRVVGVWVMLLYPLQAEIVIILDDPGGCPAPARAGGGVGPVLSLQCCSRPGGSDLVNLPCRPILAPRTGTAARETRTALVPVT